MQGSAYSDERDVLHLVAVHVRDNAHFDVGPRRVARRERLRCGRLHLPDRHTHVSVGNTHVSAEHTHVYHNAHFDVVSRGVARRERLRHGRVHLLLRL